MNSRFQKVTSLLLLHKTILISYYYATLHYITHAYNTVIKFFVAIIYYLVKLQLVVYMLVSSASLWVYVYLHNMLYKPTCIIMYKYLSFLYASCNNLKIFFFEWILLSNKKRVLHSLMHQRLFHLANYNYLQITTYMFAINVFRNECRRETSIWDLIDKLF